jgi:hypothetical protein
MSGAAVTISGNSRPGAAFDVEPHHCIVGQFGTPGRADISNGCRPIIGDRMSKCAQVKNPNEEMGATPAVSTPSDN